MTMVIGIHGGDFVLIGADSRSMQLDNDGVTWLFNDEEEKVYETGIGVMSGAGHWAAIAIAGGHMRLATEPNDLRAGLEQGFQDLQAHHPEQVVNARAATHLIQSYVDPGGELVLATISPEDNYQEHRIPAGEHVVIPTAGMTQAMEDELNARIRQAIADGLRDNGIAWNVRAENAGRIIQTAMRAIGAQLQTISPRTYQLGLLDRVPLIHVCEITNDIATVEWRAPAEPHVREGDDD